MSNIKYLINYGFGFGGSNYYIPTYGYSSSEGVSYEPVIGNSEIDTDINDSSDVCISVTGTSNAL